MMVPVVDVHGTEHARVPGVGCRGGAVTGAGIGVMRGDGPTVETCVTVRAGKIEPPRAAHFETGSAGAVSVPVDSVLGDLLMVAADTQREPPHPRSQHYLIAGDVA